MYPEQDDQQQQEKPPPPPKPVDPALLQKAVMRFRNNARGNGLNPHTILLDNFEGETLEFEAKSLFEIKATRAEKNLPGKETHGIVCASELDMHSKVKQAVEKTTVNRVIIRAATDFLEHRKDKGFLVDNLVIKLDRLNKTFIFYNIITQGERNEAWAQGHAMRINIHLIPFFGEMPIKDINAGLMQEYRVAKNTNGYKGRITSHTGAVKAQLLGDADITALIRISNYTPFELTVENSLRDASTHANAGRVRTIL